MKALVVNAEWAPRPGAHLTPEQVALHWAENANLAWKNPDIALEQRPDPTSPGPSQVILEVGACGICGSDVHMYEVDEENYMILPYHLRAPVVAGHEFAGKAVEVGSEVKDIRPGDLVAVEEIQWCGTCRSCRGGFLNQCDRIEDLGFTIDGGLAQFAQVDAKYCWSLNHLLDRYGSEERVLEAGALCEPTSVSYEGMFSRAGGFKPGGVVVVFGAGPIGLAATALANAGGASQVLTVEKVAERRALADGIGATLTLDPVGEDISEAVLASTRGVGADMLVETTGNFAKVLPACEPIMAVGAKVVVVGMEPTHPELDLLRYQLRAGSLYGTVGHSGSWDFPMVINLMASGKIDMTKAVTKRVALQSVKDAVGEMKQRSQGKILVKPGGGA